MIDKKHLHLFTFLQLLLVVSDNLQWRKMQILKPYVCNQCNVNYQLLFFYVLRDNFPQPYAAVEERYICFKNIYFLLFFNHYFCLIFLIIALVLFHFPSEKSKLIAIYFTCSYNTNKLM